MSFNGDKLPLCTENEGLCTLEYFVEFLEKNSMKGEINELANKYCRDIEIVVTKTSSWLIYMLSINAFIIVILMVMIIWKKRSHLEDN